MILMMTNL